MEEDLSTFERFEGARELAGAAGDAVYFSGLPGGVTGSAYVAKYEIDQQRLSVISDNQGAGAGVSLQSLGDLLYDPRHKRLIAEDVGQILLLDAKSGDRVVLMR